MGVSNSSVPTLGFRKSVSLGYISVNIDTPIRTCIEVNCPTLSRYAAESGLFDASTNIYVICPQADEVIDHGLFTDESKFTAEVITTYGIDPFR